MVLDMLSVLLHCSPPSRNTAHQILEVQVQPVAPRAHSPDVAQLISNDRLRAAVQRVLARGGKGSTDAVRYDKQHHRHNKS